jgi:hypothetical protein
MHFGSLYQLTVIISEFSKENEIITKALFAFNFYQVFKKRERETKQHEMMRPNNGNSFTMITFNFFWVIQWPVTMDLQSES